MIQKRNLTKEKIIQTTFLLADEIGLNQVTFSKIAEKLDIKYPSLYNHFNNIENLKIEMTSYFLNELNLNLMQRLVGKSGEEAIREFANVYRDYAFNNKTGYALFINIANIEDDKVDRLVKETSNIIYQVLNFYIKDDILLIHKSRALRSFLHGFISLNSIGYFQGPVKSDDTFQMMVDDFILSLSRK